MWRLKYFAFGFVPTLALLALAGWALWQGAREVKADLQESASMQTRSSVRLAFRVNPVDAVSGAFVVLTEEDLDVAVQRADAVDTYINDLTIDFRAGEACLVPRAFNTPEPSVPEPSFDLVCTTPVVRDGRLVFAETSAFPFFGLIVSPAGLADQLEFELAAIFVRSAVQPTAVQVTDEAMMIWLRPSGSVGQTPIGSSADSVGFAGRPTP